MKLQLSSPQHFSRATFELLADLRRVDSPDLGRMRDETSMLALGKDFFANFRRLIHSGSGTDVSVRTHVLMPTWNTAWITFGDGGVFASQ